MAGSNNSGERRVSLKDVAAAAGVGFGTVSRTLSGSGYVAEETRQRVLDAAERLGYRPNRLAAGLRSNRSHLVALLVPDYTNEFYAVGSAAAERLLRASGYQLIIASSSNSAEERATIESIAEYHVDGIVRVPVDPDLKIKLNCPVVELNRRSNIPGVPAVVCDDRTGFHALTRELIRLGHRRITLIVGEDYYSTTRERTAGYIAAIKEADDPAITVDILSRSYDAEWGHEATLDALNSDNPPTAIIAASPRIASGTVSACIERGVKVPEELALVSYSDAEWFDFYGGGIHSFVPPLDDMARRAVEILLKRLEDPKALPETVILPGSIHEGGSIGAALG
ncbi:MAG: LacI family DNA-binding transcriptional regulator [Ancrocorticia sp.]